MRAAGDALDGVNGGLIAGHDVTFLAAQIDAAETADGPDLQYVQIGSFLRLVGGQGRIGRRGHFHDVERLPGQDHLSMTNAVDELRLMWVEIAKPRRSGGNCSARSPLPTGCCWLAPTSDVYAVDPDGAGLHALTSDGVSALPAWTRGGRIVFVRWTDLAAGEGDLWVMDGDGGNATPIDANVPALTSVGCAVCPYPYAPNLYWTPEGYLNERLWQPMPGDRP